MKLLALQCFYRQLAWSAIFTANQFQGEYVSSPRYVVVSPDWARFYNLEVAFAGERPLDREQLKKKVAADKETALAVLGQGGGSPASPGSLARAFDALAQVAEQGLSVYNQGGFIPLQRWARCFDADNVAVASTQIALELDRGMLARGWKFRTAREFFAAAGIDADGSVAVGLDLERNKRGATKAMRSGLVVALVGGAAAGGIIAVAAPSQRRRNG